MKIKLSASHLKTILAMALLAALVAVFFWKILFTSALAYGRDLFVIFYPWRKFLFSSFAQGLIPLWNPYTYGGSPFLANMHSAVLYPLNIFFLFSPLAQGLAYFVVLHIFLAATFMYLYAREVGVSQAGSLIAAISFAFSGWFVKHFEVIPHPATVAWAPLIFFFYEKALKHNGTLARNKYLILGGAAFALQVLSGHPLFVYTIFSLLIYSIFMAVHGRRGGAKSSAKPLASFAIISASGSLFSAAQLLPAYEYVVHSNRTNMSYDYATQLSLPIKQLLGAFAPYLFGDPANNTYWGSGFFWMMTIYTGVGALFLALVASLANFHQVRVKFLTSLAIISLVLSLGNNTPLYYAIYAVPAFGKLRYPAMFVSSYIFAVAALAGIGYDSLEEARRKKGALISAIATFAVAAVAIAAMIYLHWNKLYLLAWALPYLWWRPLRDALGFFSTMAYRTSLFHLYAPLALTLAVLAAAAALKLSHRAIKPVRIFLLSFITFDLLLFGMKLSPLTQQELYSAQPSSASFLRADKDYFRIWAHRKARVDLSKFYNYSFRPSGFGSSKIEVLLKMKEALPYNVPMAYGIFSAMGYDSIKVNRYRTYGIAAEEAFDKSGHSMLDLLNVKYIMSYEKLLIEDLEQVWSGDSGMRIYVNKTYLPRAYFASDIKMVKGEEAVMDEIKKPGFNPRAYIVVDESELKSQKSKPREQGSQGSASKGEGWATIVAYGPNSIKIRAGAAANSYLVLSEVYFPGWKAYVDGKAAEIIPANLIFRAIPFPSGEHEVILNYEPFTFKLGAALSIASILGAILYSFGLRRSAWRRDGHLI